jgi:hypothetical protein
MGEARTDRGRSCRAVASKAARNEITLAFWPPWVIWAQFGGNRGCHGSGAVARLPQCQNSIYRGMLAALCGCGDECERVAMSDDRFRWRGTMRSVDPGVFPGFVVAATARCLVPTINVVTFLRRRAERRHRRLVAGESPSIRGRTHRTGQRVNRPDTGVVTGDMAAALPRHRVRACVFTSPSTPRRAPRQSARGSSSARCRS